MPWRLHATFATVLLRDYLCCMPVSPLSTTRGKLPRDEISAVSPAPKGGMRVRQDRGDPTGSIIGENATSPLVYRIITVTDLPSLCVMSAMKGFGQFRKVRTDAQEDTCSFSIDCLPCIEQTKEMRARRTGTSFDKRRAKRFSNYRREHSGSHHHVTKHEPSITSPPQNKFLSTR